MTGAVDVDAQRRHRTSNPSQGGPRRGTNQQTDGTRDLGHRPVRRRVGAVGALSHGALAYRRVLAQGIYDRYAFGGHGFTICGVGLPVGGRGDEVELDIRWLPSARLDGGGWRLLSVGERLRRGPDGSQPHVGELRPRP